jgi:hypothetical protein
MFSPPEIEIGIERDFRRRSTGVRADGIQPVAARRDVPDRECAITGGAAAAEALSHLVCQRNRCLKSCAVRADDRPETRPVRTGRSPG